MSHNNSIKKLLNIKEDILKIINVEDENIDGITNKVIYAIATKDNSNCSCCSNKLVKNGSKIVNIKILKSCQYNSILRVKKQRYFCKNCNKSFSQELNFVDKNCSISNDVKLAIKDDYKVNYN
ncbi:transposase family protein [Fusobacterium sp.]|uniref:transposase family protein n=1 Tax=Fusobacterium sp. TaxID=68766 RepID=UPI0025BEEBBD|nr:transposase family protein [Fusobacterium sp.]MCI5725564.1 transposase family protein [Fusobacterium sp.]